MLRALALNYAIIQQRSTATSERVCYEYTTKKGGNSLSTMNTTDELLKRIEYLRYRMAEVALEKGFTNLEAIELSQELDELLNKYDIERQIQSRHMKY
ncbi:Spo0E like sporulation regulatory protein [Virgibacillus chiguensis]|uniref:Spo0E like sporulation regulatory protein n=2 Tax=Virgibacillus TaxID=84406 RepID=A0A1M5NLP1_9BACI|nr:Spo0E like sporulation regulatory protein [Virgibacillus chiguensis]